MSIPPFYDATQTLLTPEKYLGEERPKLPGTFFLFFYDSQTMKDLNRTQKPVKVKNIPGVHFESGGAGYKKMMMGSDMSVYMLELLMACGVNNFIVFGTACSLVEEIKPNQLCLLTSAVCEEGVSMHYAPYAREVTAHNINAEIVRAAYKTGIPLHAVKACTIAAIFRETAGKIESLRREGVSVLEMEASALISAANSKKASISFLFAVSDRIIGTEWQKWGDLQFNSETELINNLMQA